MSVIDVYNWCTLCTIYVYEARSFALVCTDSKSRVLMTELALVRFIMSSNESRIVDGVEVSDSGWTK